MNKLFGEYPLTELNYETPFQCLIAVVMSAQTTDKQVNKVTASLFQAIQWPQDVLDMWWETFSQKIKTIGLWKGKARNIFETSKVLLGSKDVLWKKTSDSRLQTTEKGSNSSWWGRERNDERVYKSSDEVFETRWYTIPDTIQEMVKLPGVWIKTAKVVLYVLYRQRWVAVDTHVHRVMNRLWVVNTKMPEQTSNQLETIIPDSYKDIAHHTIIYFGRYLCIARKPKCNECPLTRMCPYFKELKKKK